MSVSIGVGFVFVLQRLFRRDGTGGDDVGDVDGEELLFALQERDLVSHGCSGLEYRRRSSLTPPSTVTCFASLTRCSSGMLSK